MGKSNIDLARLELLIRGADPEGTNEIAFLRCYVGTIVNEPLMDIARGLREILDIDKLDAVDWKYLFLGLVMGDNDYREAINKDNKETIH